MGSFIERREILRRRNANLFHNEKIAEVARNLQSRRISGGILESPHGLGVLLVNSRRAVVASFFLPQPDRDSGGKRLHDLIGFLLEDGWKVDFVALHGIDKHPEYARALAERGVTVHDDTPPIHPDGTWTRNSTFAELIGSVPFDLALLSFWPLAELYLPQIREISPHTRVIVDSVDLHFLRESRLIKTNPRSATGPLLKHYAADYISEINVYKAADAVLTVSDAEKQLLETLAGSGVVARAVVDCEEANPSPYPLEERSGLLFLGSFNHMPNVEALAFLLNDVLPLVDPGLLARHPLDIVGDGLTENLAGGHEHVRLVGWVPDVTPFFHRARASVVPLRSGAGTKRKVVQALMHGTPTVTTSIGAEGLDLTANEHVLIADDAAAIAAGIERLLVDDGLCRHLATQAFQHIRGSRNREVARNAFLKVVHEMKATAPKPSILPGASIENYRSRLIRKGEERIAIQRLAASSCSPPALSKASIAICESKPVKRALICNYFLPQSDLDSFSRRQLHFIEFLREKGWDITCVADQSQGFGDFGWVLEEMGVDIYLGIKKHLPKLLRSKQFDIAIMGLWHVAELAIPILRKCSPKTRLIVDSGDIAFLRESRRLIGNGGEKPAKLDDAFHSIKSREIEAYQSADAVFAVSQKEVDLIADLIGNDERTHLVPDCEDLESSTHPFRDRRGMFFVGNFEHLPNPEAVEYLCKKVLPLIDPNLLAKHPVYIAGNAMTPEVRHLAEGMPDVVMLGWVPSVLPYLEQVRISLLPLLHGAGTKRKLIQSLCTGTPTVTTSVGIEGFELVNGRDLLVADDPEKFAAAITRLLQDEELWGRLSEQGREVIRSCHSREVARERLLDSVAKVCTANRETPVFSALNANQRSKSVGTGTEPAISVVIPTRNRARFLEQSLASLARQTASEPYEVIVVNDGSTDETIEVCKRWRGSMPLTLVNAPFGGISAAKNLGVEAAHARLVLFFDDDDVADGRLIEEHLCTHQIHPQEHVSVLGFTDWHPRLKKTQVMRYITEVGHYLFGYTRLQQDQALNYHYFWGGRSSCKKSLLVRAGGFRPEFTFGSEDIEAGYRMSKLLAQRRTWDRDLLVIYNRRAVQHMVRPITYDEFCLRCERQGRSQWLYNRHYADPDVAQWCLVLNAKERWNGMKDELPRKVERVHNLEELLRRNPDVPDRDELIRALHSLYQWTFDAFKIKGIAEAAEAYRKDRIDHFAPHASIPEEISR